MKKAVILLSGGIDSSTVMAIAKSEGYGLYALSIDYGQRHAFELKAAAKIASAMGAEKQIVLKTGLNLFEGSALFGTAPVPKHASGIVSSGSIPVTYVPARNTVFLSLALAWAEALDASDLFIGVNAVDYSGYPDCRPAFIEAFEHLANLGTKAGIEGKPFRVHAPLLAMTKAEIIQKGISLGVDYSMTHSCYDPSASGKACGRCESCLLRKKGFRDAGVPDPTEYGESASQE